jgi:hypothetical protein
LVDLIDQTEVNGEALNAYSILPREVAYPYVRIDEVVKLDNNPCEKNEHLAVINIVTKSKSYAKAFDIMRELEQSINNFLKLYFDTQILVRFFRVRTMQIREDINGIIFTLSVFN